MRDTISKVLQSTDWALLAEQKAELVNLALPRHFADLDPLLSGLLAWIDALQDAAQADGYPVVFLTEEEE